MSRLHAALPRIESVLGPSVESADLILEYGIVPPLPHPPFPTSLVLLTQASNTTTTSQPSRTAGEVPPPTAPPHCVSQRSQRSNQHQLQKSL
jgi:hypothetical protein